MTRPLHPLSDELIKAVESHIDRQEVIDLTLALCNIPSPMRQEKAAGDFVYNWMLSEGFSPRRVGMVEHRFNVVGQYGGEGDGPNLLFTSHLDTESPFYDARDRWSMAESSVADRQWLEAWLEGDQFFGHAVGNDRGPMVCFLLAAKALKAAGIRLAGTMVLTACPGEIGPEPAEDCSGIDYLGKELGAGYMLTHGGVAPDYVISAEGTDFGVNAVACGNADFCITLQGQAVFTPMLQHPESNADHPNPIVRLGGLIDAVQSWAKRFEVENRYVSGGGTAIPKVQIGAVRGGIPQAMGAGSEICKLYVHVNLTPAQTIGAVTRSLKIALREAGLGDAQVEPYTVRHGFDADRDAVAPLEQALDAAHRVVRGTPQLPSDPFYASMWRDHNIFNMNRIPAVTSGPVRWRPTVTDLWQCTRMYALTTLALCGVLPE